MNHETPRAAYEAWLAGRASGEILSGPDLGDSSFKLFYLAGSAPGTKLFPAAASTSTVVIAGNPTGWGPFLRSAEPRVLQGQIGWMNGAWASASPTRPSSTRVMKDPKVAKYLAEPKVEEGTDGSVSFEAFYGEPPSFDPALFRARVRADGKVTFSYEPVWKMP